MWEVPGMILFFYQNKPAALKKFFKALSLIITRPESMWVWTIYEPLQKQEAAYSGLEKWGGD